MNPTNLAAVPVGSAATISSLGRDGPVTRRLLDLGLTPGTVIRCLYDAPSGDPRAYLIRGAVIALRHGEAEDILLTAHSNR